MVSYIDRLCPLARVRRYAGIEESCVRRRALRRSRAPLRVQHGVGILTIELSRYVRSVDGGNEEYERSLARRGVAVHWSGAPGSPPLRPASPAAPCDS
jgi:hypothetical protein